MKTKYIKSIIAIGFVAFATVQLSAQISGQVVNLLLNRYNSAPNGDKVPVHDGENIANIQFRGWTPAAQYQTTGTISVDVTGDPAAGYLPARMSFRTGGTSQQERMSILENGNVGIGFSASQTPITLFDVNGDARIRGLRLHLDDPTAPGGGEALTRIAQDCGGAPLPNANGLALNHGGGFTDGVFVEGPGGLKVCATLEAACLEAENNVVSNNGDIVALGGGAPIACVPGQGDIITHGANGDLITHHGHVLAMEGDVVADLGDVRAGNNVTAQNNVTATAGDVSAGNNVTAQNDVTATSGDVSAGNNVSAGQDVTAGNNVSAVAGSVTAGTNVSAGGNVSAGANVAATANVTAGNNVSATNNVSAGNNVTASNDVVSNFGNVRATNGDLRAGGDVVVDGVGRIGNIVGDPTGHALAVGGSIIATEIKVELQGNWPDYVFAKQYELQPLGEVKEFIEENQHLPGIPSAAQMQQDGQSVGEMQRLMLEKVEELYLHLIRANERMEALENENAELRKLVEARK